MRSCCCVCVFVRVSPIVARQRLGKKPLFLLGHGSVETLPLNEYTRNDRRIVGSVVLYAVRVLSKESRRLFLLRTSYILGTYSRAES
jgi:hypothetical protein